MPRGKSLKIYMMDGEVTGRWMCTLAGRTTKAYRIPRTYYKKCSEIEELHKTAVYLLFGEDEETDRKAVYIGETGDFFDRLGDHAINKDFWTEAIAFISQDEHFNKAHVKFLEGRLYDIAAEVDRYKIMNTSKPKSAAIAIDEQAEMEDFIDNIQVLTFALGHVVFEMLRKPDTNTMVSYSHTDDEYFYLTGKNIDAKMFRSAEGYVLCKGSKINAANNKSTPSWAVKRREELIREGSLINDEIIRDVVFASPSGASDLVTGNSTSGRQRWKNKQGTSLGEILDMEESV